MSGAKAKCPICGRGFLGSDKIVRVLAEMVERNPRDGMDIDYWSKVTEWEPMVSYHLRCVRNSVEEGLDFDYEDELGCLPLFDADIGKEPNILRVVEGGKR